MQVEVRVFATLRKYVPEIPLGGTTLDVRPGTTLAELRDMLRLPAEETKLAMRNNLHAEFTEVLADGDRVAYIPAVAGG